MLEVRSVALQQSAMEVGKLLGRLSISSKSQNENEVVLEAGLWEALPEEILHRILMWLPPAAQSRFRCVCSQWRSLLSSSPSWFQHSKPCNSTQFCTIMSGWGEENDRFFCHTEQKWFRIPFNPPRCLEVPMQLVDVDGGLFCYQCYLKDGLWFVCNPMTGSGRVVPSTDPPLEENASHFEMLKFIVDRKTKSYKVVVLRYCELTTLVFDSLTGRWRAFRSFPMRPLDLSCIFVYNNVLYVRSEDPGILSAFALASGTWSEVKVEAPCEPGAQTKVFTASKVLIVCNDDRVFFVHIEPWGREPICIWQLLDDEPGIPTFSASRWKKVPMNFPTAMRALAGEFRACIPHGQECMCFVTCTTNQWMKYTFATESWCTMPSRGDFVAENRWFGWEPGLDMDVGQGSPNCIDADWRGPAETRV